MMCLRKFEWIMLPRKGIPSGKGIMGAWMRLVSRAAYRKGKGRYCGHENDVTPGMWAGGVVGLKSILGVRRRAHAMFQLSRLEVQGYVNYNRDPKTKKLTYEVKDYVQFPTKKRMLSMMGGRHPLINYLDLYLSISSRILKSCSCSSGDLAKRNS